MYLTSSFVRALSSSFPFLFFSLFLLLARSGELETREPHCDGRTPPGPRALRETISRGGRAAFPLRILPSRLLQPSRLDRSIISNHSAPGSMPSTMVYLYAAHFRCLKPTDLSYISSLYYCKSKALLNPQSEPPTRNAQPMHTRNFRLNPRSPPPVPTRTR